MGTYIARRLLWVPVLLFLVSFITFVLGQYGPGDPVQILLGQYSDPAAVQRIREQRGLDDNIAVQYYRYVSGVVRGDFGESYQYRGRSVGELLAQRIPVSAQLNLAALIISVALGIPIGLFSALNQGSIWDTTSVAATLLAQSLPVFFTAPMLLILFALKWQLLPTHGWGGFFDTRIIMPALVIGIPGVAIITRLTRASTLEVVHQDYIRTARAKGLGERAVITRHVLRNALIPVVTTLGFSLAGLASGSFIVELYFGIPGVGLLAIESLFARDYPIIMAVVIIGTTLFVLANLLIDLAYPLLDPRIRLGGGTLGV
ncbi:MAG TPA: ABC transporter permease [Dehalococcoidia bacterium]|nr:ABC transporter permease [Dehalococcoidia bacterium]